jgi:hypothetical protein
MKKELKNPKVFQDINVYKIAMKNKNVAETQFQAEETILKDIDKQLQSVQEKYDKLTLELKHFTTDVTHWNIRTSKPLKDMEHDFRRLADTARTHLKDAINYTHNDVLAAGTTAGGDCYKAQKSSFYESRTEEELKVAQSTCDAANANVKTVEAEQIEKYKKFHSSYDALEEAFQPALLQLDVHIKDSFTNIKTKAKELLTEYMRQKERMDARKTFLGIPANSAYTTFMSTASKSNAWNTVFNAYEDSQENIFNFILEQSAQTLQNTTKV